jgi:hypothetical protein
MQQETGHLSALLQRVRNDETGFGYASKEHLINIAEYILSWPGKYSKNEYVEAVKVLAGYHLAHLASRCRGWKFVEAELAKPYRARCRRCGLPITNPASLATGHGPICRRKLGISPRADENFEGGLFSYILTKSKYPKQTIKNHAQFGRNKKSSIYTKSFRDVET